MPLRESGLFERVFGDGFYVDRVFSDEDFEKNENVADKNMF